MYKRIVVGAASCLLLALVAGCSEQHKESAQTPSAKAATAVAAAESQQAATAVHVERIAIPFEAIEGDIDLQTPPNAEKMALGVEGAAMFHPPVHPTGQVRTLKIEGLPIALKNTNLIDGLLETQDFGKIEFKLVSVTNGQTQVQLLATQEQIDQLKAAMAKNKK